MRYLYKEKRIPNYSELKNCVYVTFELAAIECTFQAPTYITWFRDYTILLRLHSSSMHFKACEARIIICLE